jgi:inosine/xanthosine triphosphatase
MNIAVATENPVKIQAVEQALAEAFPGQPIMIHKLALELGIHEQPMNEAIAVGARKRAEVAQKQLGADFGIGIEAGLMQLPGTSQWLSVQVCVIVDDSGRSSVGLGPGYELPQPILEAVLAGESLRDAFERLLAQEDPDRHGAVYYLSNGLLDRAALTVQGIRMAIIPWLSA